MGILATTQDPEVSSCMDTILHPLLSPDTPSQGYEGYMWPDMLWTKPGRVDMPQLRQWW
jgi:hypothetical protein